MKVYSMKNQFQFFVLFLFLVGSYSCSNAPKSYKENIAITESYTNESDVPEAIETKRHDTETSETVIHKELKIIKSGEVKFRVKDVKKSTTLIKALAKKYSAYVSDLRYQNTVYERENKFTIKVPKAHFDVLLDSMSTYAEFVDYENVRTKDVTEEFLDAETRLKTKLQIKERYETILRKKAKTVKDIIYAEEKLGSIQEEIEAVQGKLKYLSNKTTFSTIQVHVYEEIPHVKTKVFKQSFGSKLMNGLLFGWTFLENLVLFLVYSWPVILLSVFGFLLHKKIKKSKLQKNN